MPCPSISSTFDKRFTSRGMDPVRWLDAVTAPHRRRGTRTPDAGGIHFGAAEMIIETRFGR